MQGVASIRWRPSFFYCHPAAAGVFWRRMQNESAAPGAQSPANAPAVPLAAWTPERRLAVIARIAMAAYRPVGISHRMTTILCVASLPPEWLDRNMDIINEDSGNE